MTRLSATALRLGYADRLVVDRLDVTVPDGAFTAIIGPNACGKSTLLKALARLMPLRAGQVVLDGRDIARYPTVEVARRLGLLPQSSLAPDGITVADLVARGRFPHQRLLSRRNPADEASIAAAMAATGVTALAARPVGELSGGQRQRVWVAMALAQETEIMLLDEPTTYLDIAHQVELLELLHRLNRDGKTIVAVLHDLNQAARYADHLIALKEGRLLAQGDPRAVVTAELVQEVFGMPCRIIDDPETHTPLVIPLRPTPVS